jgi:hypothetical protein
MFDFFAASQSQSDPSLNPIKSGTEALQIIEQKKSSGSSITP